jgi:hypothetical protein
VLHFVIGHGERVGVECVGLDDVGAGLEVLAVKACDDIWSGENEQVVVAFEVPGMILESLSPVSGLVQLVGLDHGPHRPVEDHDPFLQQFVDGLLCGLTLLHYV